MKIDKSSISKISFTLLCILIAFTQSLKAQIIFAGDKIENIGEAMQFTSVEDCTWQNYESLVFEDITEAVPALDGISKGCYIFKIPFTNQSNTEDVFIEIYNPGIEEVRLQYTNAQGEKVLQALGKNIARKNWPIALPNILFEVNVPKGNTVIFYLHIKNREQFNVPINIGAKDEIYEASFIDQIVYGVFAGLLLVMIFYNLFLYFSVRDRSYLYYVAHTAFVLLTWTSFFGYGFLYLWPFSPWFNGVSFVLFTCLVSIAGIRFFFEFLKVKEKGQKIYTFLRIVEIVYLAIITIEFLGFKELAYSILFPLQGVVAVSIVVGSILIFKRGYKPAGIYILAWGVLFAGIIIFSLKDAGVLPYNYFTLHIIQFGSAIEAVILSLALANSINVLKREKEVSQNQALEALKRNEDIIREQNVVLEKRVEERTVELKKANKEISETLSNLRETQSQLVDAEKMASLGQLTAGIAHEINNPINFVTSNIKPLKRDIDELYELVDAYASVTTENAEETLKEAHDLREELDYDFLKEEIANLVQGISDGAIRTSEIVRGLRNFSRLDEDVVKKASLAEGLMSTMVLLKNKVKDIIEVEEDFDPNLPDIDCYPGKLNQVFMNILNNGIYAVTHKNYSDAEKPKLTLRTKLVGNKAQVSLIDNGIGMNEETKKKIFEPFFTTKDVGEGTGLGMSIVFKIIEKHLGSVEINSEPGVGTEFIITLPLTQPNEFE